MEQVFKKNARVALPALQESEDEPQYGYLAAHAPRHMARHDPQLAEAFDILREHSSLGGAQIKEAVQNRQLFQRRNIMSAPGGRVEGFIVTMEDVNSLTEDVSILPHELMHIRQNERGYKYAAHWDIYSRFKYLLYMEAAAESCAVRVVHQAHENGYSDAFNERARSRQFETYNSLYTLYADTINSARLAGTKNPDLDASDAVFRHYMEKPLIKKVYGALELASNILKIHNTRNPVLPRPMFNEHKARILTHVTDNSYLIKPSTALFDDDIFFTRTGYLKQAFEYADLMQTAKHFKMDGAAPVYKEKLENAISGNNPFLTLDLERIVTTYNRMYDMIMITDLPAKDKARTMMLVMMNMANIEDIKNGPDITTPVLF
jgi:hypothetical protein